MSDPVAYNSSDPLQLSLLSALALGETGNAGASGYSEGFGGVSTAGSQTDAYGFPLWNGSSTAAGPTHAAGEFQFQPGTWDSIAAAHGLNFSNPEDQNAGAWYLAQQTYATSTGGGSLEDALHNGDYSGIQQALAGTWATTGSGASPQGLAYALANKLGPDLTGANPSAQQQQAASGGSNDPLAIAGDFFVRFGLIALGVVIIVVALWQLLSTTGAVPSPGDTAKGIGNAVKSAGKSVATVAAAA